MTEEAKSRVAATVRPAWIMLVVVVIWWPAGAVDGSGEPPSLDTGKEAVTGKDRGFWSFRSLERVDPPVAGGRSGGWNWCRTPIDRFILARLEPAGLQPNPQADRYTLIRRASFDLIGLPPTPQQIDAFVNDADPKAYERLVDRLLCSPHLGERWARHWLDVARFADTAGFQDDEPLPEAYRYRDFIIAAFNQDIPYDQFVRWQLAGDELAPDNALAVTASGFLAVGVYHNPVTAKETATARYDELDDFVSTTGSAMLGLTIGCARCHDHKYDPITTQDYYRFVSTFTTAVRGLVDLYPPTPEQTAAANAWNQKTGQLEEARRKYEQDSGLRTRFKAFSQDRKALRQMQQRLMKAGVSEGHVSAAVGGLAILLGGKQLDQLSGSQGDGVFYWFARPDARWRELRGQIDEHQKNAPEPIARALVVREGIEALPRNKQGPDFFEQTHFLNRGDPQQKGAVATQSFLGVLMRSPKGENIWLRQRGEGEQALGRRRALADWITDTEHGAGHLLARVMVNRLWVHHFGRGIVNTPSDFGSQGERPTHPKLLDWLAARLISEGWQLKPIHRLIMISAAYRQTADTDSARQSADISNALYWRFSPRRLEAEAIRDAMLTVCGNLDRTMYGPGTLDEAQKRRSIYFTVKRSEPVALLKLFDAPDSLQSTGQRNSTTVAPQALALMNNTVVREFAAAFADRLAPMAEVSFAGAIEEGYRRALGRGPLDSERQRAIAFLEQQTASFESAGREDAHHQALAGFCQVLMSLNEFIYVH